MKVSGTVEGVWRVVCRLCVRTFICVPEAHAGRLAWLSLHSLCILQHLWGCLSSSVLFLHTELHLSSSTPMSVLILSSQSLMSDMTLN